MSTRRITLKRCACGCGGLVHPRLKGPTGVYIQGHNAKGVDRGLPVTAGERHGMLTAIRRIGGLGNPVECQCECGAIVVVGAHKFLTEHTKSCGVCAAKSHARHGMTRDNQAHPIYRCWTNMKTRCYNQRVKAYGDYGGRGIQVCNRWLESFDNFLADMGSTWHAGLTLEREDNDMGYSPDNCVWATRKTQANNRRNPRIAA